MTDRKTIEAVIDRCYAARQKGDIDGAMAGNICRCGTYPRIRSAIKQAAGLQGAKS
jgi:aerobic-type carbon monoxide dehydrogenase small subunit (CoxS/CutS family)